MPYSFPHSHMYSTNLVEGMARAGNGSCEYARDEKDRIQAKVLAQLKCKDIEIFVSNWKWL